MILVNFEWVNNIYNASALIELRLLPVITWPNHLLVGTCHEYLWKWHESLTIPQANDSVMQWLVNEDQAFFEATNIYCRLYRIIRNSLVWFRTKQTNSKYTKSKIELVSGPGASRTHRTIFAFHDKYKLFCLHQLEPLFFSIEWVMSCHLLSTVLPTKIPCNK